MWVMLLCISAVSAAAIGFVVWPLLRPPSIRGPAEGEELAELMTRKEAALRALRDLAFDYSVGKIEDADFERFNKILRGRALALMRRIDEFAPQTVQLEETLEEQIAARRRVEETPGREGRAR